MTTFEGAPADGETTHISVMPAETLDALRPQPGGVFIDGTLGGAGHTMLLLERVGLTGRVLAIDADPAALRRAEARLAEPIAQGRLLLRHGNFRQLAEFAQAAGIAPVDGVLLDLGLSSDQLAARERGFSFAAEGALDMRFDPTRARPWLRFRFPRRSSRVIALRRSARWHASSVCWVSARPRRRTSSTCSDG